jgi:hypothetical protein
MVAMYYTQSYLNVPPTFPYTDPLPVFPNPNQSQFNSDPKPVASTDPYSVYSAQALYASQPYPFTATSAAVLPVQSHDTTNSFQQEQQQQQQQEQQQQQKQQQLQKIQQQAQAAAVSSPKSLSTTSTAPTQQQAANKVRKIAKTLIPLNDIRRQYAHIFAEAFNGMDKDELRELLNRYAIPSCRAVYKHVGNTNPVYGPSYCELHGVEAISNYWHAIFCALPDSIFEMQESKLRVLATSSSGGGNGATHTDSPAAPCAIVMKFIFSGTKIFKISADTHSSVIYSDRGELRPRFPSSTEEGEDVNGGRPSENTNATLSEWMSPALGEELSSENNSADEDTASGEPKATRRLLHHQLGLDGCLEKSVPMTLLGTMTFFAGADKKIYKIDVVYCVRA